MANLPSVLDELFNFVSVSLSCVSFVVVVRVSSCEWVSGKRRWRRVVCSVGVVGMLSAQEQGVVLVCLSLCLQLL